MYRTEFPDIMYSVVQNLDTTMTITSIESTGSTHVLGVCDLKWTQRGYNLTIDGNTYQVTDINETTKAITVTGTESINVNSFELYLPFFLYGTPIDANNRTARKKNSTDKYPMIYLLLNFQENNQGEESSIDRYMSFRLFCLSGSDFKNWTTDNIHDNAIKPMARLMQVVKQTIESMLSSFYTEEMTFDSNPQYKFGVYVTDKGTTDSYLIDNLSGWEMVFNDLAVRKNHRCTLCIPVDTGIGAMEIESNFVVS